MTALDYESLARFYDSLVTTEDDVAFFVDLAKQASGQVLELMAGTGRISIPVALAGAELTCVDSSGAMLALLRRKLAARGLTAQVICQDVTRLSLESSFDVAFIAFNSFEELTADGDRQSLLRRVFDHLVPGGSFVCTLHDPDVRLRDVGPTRDSEWRFQDPSSGRELRLRLSTSYDRHRSVVQGRQFVEDVRTGETVADLALCFRLTSQNEFRQLAKHIGFVVQAVYGDYERGPYAAGTSNSMVWVLVRPQA